MADSGAEEGEEDEEDGQDFPQSVESHAAEPHAALEGRGGLCKYGGKNYLIVNRSLSVQERIHLLSRALSRFPLDDVFLRPQIRELLEKNEPI